MFIGRFACRIRGASPMLRSVSSSFASPSRGTDWIAFSADDLQLEGERCWKGLIVSELLTNVARHAQFDGRHPELRVKLMLAGNVVKCGVSDNGSAPEPVRRGRGLTIIGELASSLGGRVHTSCAAEGYSFLLTFPLTEAEQRAAGATHVVRLKRRKMRRPQRLQASRTEDLRAG
jgi:two-component sensor histidine kinase